MKKNHIIYIRFMMFIVYLVVGVSCKKFVDIPPPLMQAQTVEIFQNEQAAISAVTGLYSLMSTTSLSYSNGGITLHAGLTADEIVNTTSGSVDPYTTNSLLSTDGLVNSRFWAQAYKHVYHANAILEGLDKGQLPDSIRKQLRGEVLFVRAFSYFYLVNLFGDVPLILSTDYRENSIAPRTPSAEIYEKIAADLKEAEVLLRNYLSSNRARPGIMTIKSFLARVFLFRSEWTNAESRATEVIESNIYRLPRLDSVFIISSPETIWHFAKDNNNTTEGATFLPPNNTSKPPYILTTSLLSAFEPGDKRRLNVGWVDSNRVSSISYYYPKKYRFRTSTPINEFYVVFRLAEQYLIRAEARAHEGNLIGSVQDLNKVRVRSGLPALSETLSKAQVLAAVEKERRIELLIEWGHRWFDLKRTLRADAVLSISKAPTWQSTDALFPIPNSEILTNPFLTQNPGY